MVCPICKKKVSKQYILAHRKFHEAKAALNIIKAAMGLKLYTFDKEI